MLRFSLGMLGLLCLLSLGSCAEDSAARHHELEEISEHHSQELALFQQAQAEFTHENPTPRQIDYANDGTILIHECALDGPPARAEVWTRFTWVNTTDHAIDEVKVTVALKDPTDGSADHAVELRLVLPLKFRFSPDSSYTTSIGVPTEGLHLHPGWTWEIKPQAKTSLSAYRSL